MAELLRAFLALQIGVSVVLSKGASQFVRPLLFRALGAHPVYDEIFSGEDVFGHLEPGQSADAMLIAPASADIIAKMAHGLADEMLTAQFLAFSGPVAIAPAMNPRMWLNKATCANIKLLEDRGINIIPPEAGKTACGEEGYGRLADPLLIFLEALKTLSPADMSGLKVLVTLGPTREWWDCARFWTNASSGKMGAALATASWLRGADVTAICGPGINIYLPPAIKRIDVNSALEMHAEAQAIWDEMSMGLFCAAVADFSPASPVGGRKSKVKKSQLGAGFELSFRANPDILAALSAQREGKQKILGFAAETVTSMEELLALAQVKLTRKGADMIAANLINDGVFGAETGRMAIVDYKGGYEIWPHQPKADIAWNLLTWLLNL